MELSLKEISGRRFYYRPDSHDFSILTEVWIEGHYSKYFPFGQKSVIVDIGAHNGYFSVFASLNTAQGSAVYAFEPVAANYDILIKNIALNSLDNVHARNVGVSKSCDPITLFINSAHTGGHSIYRERVEKYEIATIEKIEMMCIAFKDIAPPDVEVIDYCKMDIEGAEFEVLLNTPKEIMEKVKVYALEFHEFGGYKAGDLLSLFNRLGYSVEHDYVPSKRGIRYGYMWAIKDVAGIPGKP